MAASQLILNVDDTEASRYAKTRTLRGAGFEVIEADHGEEALRLIEERHPSLVLLDVQLPDISGLEVCRRIKGTPVTRRLPVLHISATYVTEADRKVSAESGADIYLVEPISPEELITVVRTLLRLQTIEVGLAESETRLRLAVEGAQIGTWDTNLRTGESIWSSRTLQMLGYATSGTRAHWESWFDRIHPDDRDRVRDGLAAVSAGRTLFQVEHRIIRADTGEERWLAPVAVVYPDERGDPTRLIGVVTDVTARKQEDAYRERRLELEQHARNEAEHSTRMKDQFLATLSHELRTPMGAIVGWLHLVRNGMLDESATARALETIDQNVRLQNKLINDILDVSRIVNGRLRLAVDDVKPLRILASSIDAIRPAAAAKRIDIATEIVDADTVTRGDAGRLQQVFTNLLNNAVKFVPEGGRIVVGAGRDGEVLRLTVRDFGEGINPTLLPHVFERFRQGDGSLTRRHGGLGLGLAIARYLVERHGGAIAAASEGTGKGSTFTVELPLGVEPKGGLEDAPPHAGVEAAAPAVKGRLEGAMILVVDDNADSVAMLSEVFRIAGATVDSANSVAEAIARFDAGSPFDVLVSDIGMPTTDGYQLVDAIAKRYPERRHKLIAVAATGYAREEDRERALSAGFDAHIAKPIDIPMLVETVARLFSKRSTRDARDLSKAPQAPSGGRDEASN